MMGTYCTVVEIAIDFQLNILSHYLGQSELAHHFVLSVVLIKIDLLVHYINIYLLCYSRGAMI